ncbi:hypothetical protein AB0D49_39420 [Streptomyces sp. NPDC048290]|uniref:hypothetical protein n=1 Tax=Streptomyces sp. NPDC048290 TaxID=3155811 RepID=UPI00342176C2
MAVTKITEAALRNFSENELEKFNEESENHDGPRRIKNFSRQTGGRLYGDYYGKIMPGPDSVPVSKELRESFNLVCKEFAAQLEKVQGHANRLGVHLGKVNLFFQEAEDSNDITAKTMLEVLDKATPKGGGPSVSNGSGGNPAA